MGDRTPQGNPGTAAWRQRLRLASGLVLMAFAVTHLLNHALGIHSLAAMEAGRLVFLAVWRSAPGEVLLLASLLIHVTLTLWKTARRRTWRLPAWQWLQLLLGLAIPYLLIPHAVGTHGLAEQFGFDDTYRNVLTVLWPGLVVNQTLLMALVWVHGMLGLHFWLRIYPGYRTWFPMMIGLGVLVPVLATWGWIDTARRLALTQDVAFPLTREMIVWADPVILGAQRVFFAMVVLVVVVLAFRVVRRRFRRTIEVAYPGGRVVRVAPGPTLLEVSRMNAIPHADVCGGRARCSTCRTRILKGLESLPDPAENERKVLLRIGAEPRVRLACQIRPQADLVIQPLVPAAGAVEVAPGTNDAYHWGVEQPVAILFVDLRNFTSMAENRLSYDTVFLLNRYLGETARAIEACGGYVDKFIGDGVMAIFGMREGLHIGCRNAVAATNAIAESLEALNKELESQLDAPLRIGMGLHAGPVILGRIGAAGASDTSARITALGDVVNTASRLEAATKDLGASLAVSKEVLDAAGLACDASEPVDLTLRGRHQSLPVYALTPPVPLTDRMPPAAAQLTQTETLA